MDKEQGKHKLQRNFPKIYEVLKNLSLILVFNLFCYVFFSMFVESAIKQSAHYNNDNSAQRMVMVFSIVCYVGLFFTYLLFYKKNSQLQRDLQSQAKQNSFTVKDFYISYMKKTFWAVPITVAVLLLPFTIYFSAGGFGYEVGLFYEYFFAPQMLFYELTKIAFLAWFLNIIIFTLFSYISHLLVFILWHKDYKNMHG